MECFDRRFVSLDRDGRGEPCRLRVGDAERPDHIAIDTADNDSRIQGEAPLDRTGS